MQKLEKIRRVVALSAALGAAQFALKASAQDTGAPPASPATTAPPASPAATAPATTAPTASASAAGAPTSMPPNAPAPAAACFPACREGFVCKSGQCVSLCNPPCPPGQECMEGTHCEIPPPGGAIHEPPPPARVRFDEKTFSMAAFHYGFSSEVTLNGSDGPRTSVLGANLRSDVPVASYLLVGPMLEFGSYEPGYYFDLDIYLRARVPIDAKSVQFQIWAGVPVGLTFDFLSGNSVPNLDGFALGWNVGVLFGGAVHVSKSFGLFTEGGWQQHKMSHDRATGGSVELVLKPWIWNVGFVFRG